MKKNRVLALILVLSLLFTAFSGALAEDNPEGSTIEENTGTIDINYGTVTDNAEGGIIQSNVGKVETNNGYINSNSENGVVDVNYGTIDRSKSGSSVNTNNGTIEYVFSLSAPLENNGTIVNNRFDKVVNLDPDSEVTHNYSEVIINYGTVVTNESGGKVNNNCVGATVETNAEGATVGCNLGTVVLNNGTVTNCEGGAVTTNSGTISKVYDGGTVTTNSGTISKVYEGGAVTTNSGTISKVYDGGTVTTNSGTISKVYDGGTVTTNSGNIESVGGGGTVTTNNGAIGYYDASAQLYVGGNEGTVETNNGTIAVNSGTVETNNGDIGFYVYVDATRYMGGNFGTVDYNEGLVMLSEGGTVTENAGCVMNGAVAADGSVTYGTATVYGMTYAASEEENAAKTYDQFVFEPEENGEKQTYTVLDYADVESELGKAKSNQKFNGWQATYEEDQGGTSTVVTKTFQAGDTFSQAGAIKFVALWKTVKKAGTSLGATFNADGSVTVLGGKSTNITRIKVGNLTLTEADYTLVGDAENGFSIVFTDAFLASLEAGEHLVDIAMGSSYAAFMLVI